MKYDEILSKIKRIRVFDGKKFVRYDFYDEKRDAIKKAKTLRSKGVKVRRTYSKSVKVHVLYTRGLGKP